MRDDDVDDDYDDDWATQDCMYRYTMYYPVTFIDDDCIAPPDKGSYIHYIVVFAIILPIHIYYIH